MDKRPKRSRDKYNPYTLHSEKAKNIYRVTFSNQNKTINIAITKEIFDELDENEKEDARQIQKIARYNERNIVTESTLNKRVFNKPEDVEEIVIRKINNEKLKKQWTSLLKNKEEEFYYIMIIK